MYRFAALIALLATPLAAQDKETLCVTTSEIAGMAVTERIGGADEMTAVSNVEQALPDDKATYRPAVAPIVQWVYTLEADQLTDEVASSYKDACLAQ